MKKEIKCNYCDNRIPVDSIGKTLGWIKISKLKPNNISITGCPIHYGIVLDLYQDWMKKSGENDEYRLERLEDLVEQERDDWDEIDWEDQSGLIAFREWKKEHRKCKNNGSERF